MAHLLAMSAPETPLAPGAPQHIPPEVVETWGALMRPAVWLRASRENERVAGHLGGVPSLPVDVAWPIWQGHGPLSFIAAVDCGALPSRRLDIELPERGTLLFFYFDGRNGGATFWGPEAQAGGRVIHVPEGVAATERSTPSEISPYARVTLTAELVETWPTWEHPATLAAFGALDAEDMTLALLDHPINDSEFRARFRGHPPGRPRHQIGGYAEPVQCPVEWDAAEASLGDRSATPEFRREMTRWVLLAQIDTDGATEMDWGDTGTVYWMMRPEDLAARRFDAAVCTMQSS